MEREGGAHPPLEAQRADPAGRHHAAGRWPGARAVPLHAETTRRATHARTASARRRSSAPLCSTSAWGSGASAPVRRRRRRPASSRARGQRLARVIPAQPAHGRLHFGRCVDRRCMVVAPRHKSDHVRSRNSARAARTSCCKASGSIPKSSSKQFVVPWEYLTATCYAASAPRPTTSRGRSRGNSRLHTSAARPSSARRASVAAPRMT